MLSRLSSRPLATGTHTHTCTHTHTHAHSNSRPSVCHRPRGGPLCVQDGLYTQRVCSAWRSISWSNKTTTAVRWVVFLCPDSPSASPGLLPDVWVNFFSY